MKNNKVLVTGANGFVGTALLEKLVEETDCKIIAMHRNKLTSEIEKRFASLVQWVQADITTEDLSKAVADVQTVFHLAAHSSMSETSAERNLMEQVNVLGTKRLAVACKEAGVQHFIYVSSIAACESGSLLLIDESNGFPVSSYGKSKRDAEDLLLKLCGNGFEVTVLRSTVLFGENHLGSIYELVKTISLGRFVIFGKGNNYTNFYYIRDFIHVLLAIKNNAKSHGQVFIAADRAYQLNDVVTCITQALEYRRSIFKIPVLLGYILATMCDIVTKLSGKEMPLSKKRYKAMTRNITYSNSKLTKVLNISPMYGLLEGIHNTVKWYRDTGL